MENNHIIHDPLGFKGKVLINSVRNGMDFKVEDLDFVHQTRVETHFEPGVRLVIPLNGLTDLRIGKQKIRFENRARESAAWFSVQKDEYGFKHFEQQANKREVVFFFSFSWMKDSLSDEQYERSIDFFSGHLRMKHFVFSPLMRSSINSLFYSSEMNLNRLQKESLCLLLIDDALNCMRWEKQTNNERLFKAVNNIDALLKMGQGYDLSISDMAKLCHTNTSTLQRFFKQHYGIGIGAYRRKLQLQKAHQALERGCSVMQAACLAEYTHLQSFSDAFRREFGYLPKHVKK